jgi:hypothetical protein
MNIIPYTLKSAVLTCTILAAIIALFSPLFTTAVYAYNSYGVCHINKCVQRDIFGNCTHHVNRSGPYTWPQGRTTMHISTTSFPAGSAWDARLQSAMWHWNNVKGSNFAFFVGRDTDGTYNTSNGVNEIGPARADSGVFDSEDTLAAAKRRQRCDYDGRFIADIVEADILFNTRFSWSTDPYDYSNPDDSPQSFEGVALHELGHALGLGHENRVMATMNSYYPNSGPFGHRREWDPFGDDRLGVRFLYPDQTTETDIAASPLKSRGEGRSGLVSSPSSATRGSTVDIEFTFSNLGTSAVTFDIGFYLSRDSTIDISDTLLGMNRGASAPPGATGTHTRTLTIPNSITPGTYYLGFIVDPYNEIPEDNETNNSQEMPRTITIRASEPPPPPPPLPPSDDHGNTSGTATRVGVNSSTAGSIEAGGDVDYFRIDLSQAGTLTVRTTGSTDTVGSLIGQDGNIIATDDGAGEGQNFRISRQLNAGTYFIAVRGFSNSTGSYTLRVEFQPSNQNQGRLENPGHGAFVSGIGLISGWVCTANRVEIEMNGVILQASYGTSREDTRPVCGDANNGFGLLFNWNLLGDGVHRLRALADGVAFADVTFLVTTLGTQFLQGASGTHRLADFPRTGDAVTVQWQESAQNFVIVRRE